MSKMSKKKEEELKQMIAQQLQSALEHGVVAGFKEAHKQIIEDIDSGITIEELRERIVGKIKKTEVVEEVKYPEHKENPEEGNSEAGIDNQELN